MQKKCKLLKEYRRKQIEINAEELKKKTKLFKKKKHCAGKQNPIIIIQSRTAQAKKTHKNFLSVINDLKCKEIEKNLIVQQQRILVITLTRLEKFCQKNLKMFIKMELLALK